MSFNQIIAKNVRYHRKRRGLTQEELAYRAGMTTSEISRIEHGKNDCRVSTLQKLSWALGIPAMELFRDDPAEWEEGEPRPSARLDDRELKQRVLDAVEDAFAEYEQASLNG